MDKEQILSFLIKIGLIGQENIEKARAALAGLKDETTSLAEQQDPALAQDYAQSLEHASEGAEHLAVNSREAHMVCQGLNRLMPGLGHAMRGLFDPAALQMVGFVLLLEEVNQLFEMHKQKIEEAQKAQAEYLDGWRTGLSEARNKIIEFHDALDKASKPSDEFQEQFTIRKKTLEEEYAGKEKIAKAEGDNNRVQKLKDEQKRKELEIVADILKQLDDRADDLQNKIADTETDMKRAAKFGDKNGEKEATDLYNQYTQEALQVARDKRDFQRQANAGAESQLIDQDVNYRLKNLPGAQKALAAAETISNRGAKTDQEQQFVMRLGQLASGKALNLEQAEKYFQALEKTPAALEAVLNRITGYNQRVLDAIVRQDARMTQFEAQLSRVSNNSNLH